MSGCTVVELRKYPFRCFSGQAQHLKRLFSWIYYSNTYMWKTSHILSRMSNHNAITCVRAWGCNRFYIYIAGRGRQRQQSRNTCRHLISSLPAPSPTTWTPLVQSKKWIHVEENQIIRRKEKEKIIYHAKHGEHDSYGLQAPCRPQRGGHYGENNQVPIQTHKIFNSHGA